MRTELIDWLVAGVAILWRNASDFMVWNLFLAFIPLVLSIGLFRRGVPRNPLGVTAPKQTFQSPSLLWWLGFAAFIVFLPNAPYVLTDVIHLVQDIRQIQSIWLITLAVIPLYLVFVLAGFEAYVLSLINLTHYLRRQGWGRFILSTELLLHGLTAIGIYLGRFKRFNSWHIVTRPSTLAESMLEDVLAKRPLLVILVTFLIIAGLYWCLKQLSLAVAVYRSSSARKSLTTPLS